MTVVVSTGTAEKSGLLGAIWDALVAIAGAVKKLFESCNPQVTTHVNVDKDGNITSIVTTYTCVPD